MKNKYGISKKCLYCGNQFETRPRFLDYCSQPCKNPLNRGEYDPWNKGIKLTEEQKAKQNTSGLVKGRGWNKGKSNEIARQRMMGENNPNWSGGLEARKLRQKRQSHPKLSSSRPGDKNGMWGKKHSAEAIAKMRLAKIKNYKEGVYKSKSQGETELWNKLAEQFPDLVSQYTIPNYHRIYDFYIPSINLIVEYDGDYWHREEKYIAKDLKDTNKANKEGYQIFRYWESVVKEQGIDNIVEDIVKLQGKYCRIMEKKQNGLQ